MKIAMLQTDITWQDPEANRRKIAGMIVTGGANAELIILPEMFTTGFCISPRETAESGTETLEWMQETAAHNNLAIAGSVAVEENGKYFNRMWFVKPDGTFTAYDKRHLFSFGGEDTGYSTGKERVIAEYAGFRILLQTCYDLRFPVFSRNRGDYDMIIYIADWPESRRGAWDILLRARAIENACYVAGVNRTGKEPGVLYNGGTALIDFKGQTVVAAGNGLEEIVTGEVDIEKLRQFRERFPVLADADDFKLETID